MMISIADEVKKCFKCGMCRSVCPVLDTLQIEPAGPRGKLALCEAIALGRLDLSESVCQILRECTGCRACSKGCTSGTDPYGVIASTVSNCGTLHPASGDSTPVASFLLSALKNPKEIEDVARKGTRKKASLAYFAGCVETTELPGIPDSVLRILDGLGAGVYVPDTQVCCGWPQILTGDLDRAKELALANEKAFEGFELVLASCPHCVSVLTSVYPSLLGVSSFRGRARDIFPFLVEKRFDNALGLGGSRSRTLYSHPCRMGRGKVKDSVYAEFLRKHLGSLLIEPESDLCCGSPLELSSPLLAREMLDRKLDQIKSSQCSRVVTECPFCILSLASKSAVPVVHLLQSVRILG